jgi:hypothetical protein
MGRKGPELAAIGHALNSISWEWLNDNHPELAEAIELEVGRGATPEQVRRFVVARTYRNELALRCEQAARWLVENG